MPASSQSKRSYTKKGAGTIEYYLVGGSGLPKNE